MDAQAATTGRRLAGLDAYRGLIMLLMALDHASVFAGDGTQAGGEFWGGAYPRYTDPALLLARAVTHVCAPGFALLMGMGMALFAHGRLRQGWTRTAVTRHFALRGCLLALLQFGLENPAWRWGGVFPGAVTSYFGVLFMLGAGMLLSAPMAVLRPTAPAAAGLAAMLLGWLMLPEPGAWAEPWSLAERVLAIPGFTGRTMVLFPLLPWLGVILLGQALGTLLATDRERAQRRMLIAGAALLAAYPLMRLLGGETFNLRHIPVDEWWSVLYMVKYPPSPAFLAATLGTALAAVPLLERAVARHDDRALDILRVTGSVPLFFYLLHLWLYAALSRLLVPDKTGLPGVLLLWLLGLALLVPACLAYARLRARRRRH